jgi:hypothetical protein
MQAALSSAQFAASQARGDAARITDWLMDVANETAALKAAVGGLQRRSMDANSLNCGCCATNGTAATAPPQPDTPLHNKQLQLVPVTLAQHSRTTLDGSIERRLHRTLHTLFSLRLTAPPLPLARFMHQRMQSTTAGAAMSHGADGKAAVAGACALPLQLTADSSGTAPTLPFATYTVDFPTRGVSHVALLMQETAPQVSATPPSAARMQAQFAAATPTRWTEVGHYDLRSASSAVSVVRLSGGAAAVVAVLQLPLNVTATTLTRVRLQYQPAANASLALCAPVIALLAAGS